MIVSYIVKTKNNSHYIEARLDDGSKMVFDSLETMDSYKKGGGSNLYNYPEAQQQLDQYCLEELTNE